MVKSHFMLSAVSSLNLWSEQSNRIETVLREHVLSDPSPPLPHSTPHLTPPSAFIGNTGEKKSCLCRGNSRGVLHAWDIWRDSRHPQTQNAEKIYFWWLRHRKAFFRRLERIFVKYEWSSDRTRDLELQIENLLSVAHTKIFLLQ